jgi:hypothetical protein
MTKNILDIKIRKVQQRKAGTPWVALPKGMFNKGDLVIISPFDSDTITITRRLPHSKR